LSGYTGSIIRWEASTNGGVTWTNIGNAGNATLTYNNLSQTTLYRAVVQSGPCSIAYSKNYAVVSVVPPMKPNPVTPAPRFICIGDSSVLTSGTGYLIIGITDSSGYFEQANPAGWLWDGSKNSGSAGSHSGKRI
jgi:hypothetical protein